jgi:hypothetical protein
MENLTQKNIIALGRLNLPEIVAYSQWIELFYNAKLINKDFIENLSRYCQTINECLPLLPTYFIETLPYLRKARSFLILLNQRQKGKDVDVPQLDTLFSENLQNINNFFQRFNLPATAEELSNASPSKSSNEAERPLHLRIINPNYDDSKDYKRTIKEMVRTAQSTGESNENWRNLALAIRDEYEHGAPENTDIQPVSQLLLEGVNRLFERERQFHLSEQKSQELSNIEQSKPYSKKRKLDDKLSQIADSIISEDKRNN